MTTPNINADQVAYTRFGNKSALVMHMVEQSWDQFCNQLESLKPSHKDSSNLIKFALFSGEKTLPTATTKGGCLRADEFVTFITGIEGDYDAEVITPEQARDLLEQHNIKGVIVTSHSHTPEKPRWRVYCPFSKPYSPAERMRFIRRLNGALGGILSGESFTLSQSYYVGRPHHGGEYIVLRTNPIGESCLDELDGLDAIAQGKAGGSKQDSGKSTSSSGKQRREILEQLLQGEDVHGNALVLVGKWLARGMKDDEIRLLMESIAPYVADQRGAERAECLLGSELQRMIDGGRAKGYGKAEDPDPQAEQLKAYFQEQNQEAPITDPVDLLNPPGLAGDICRYIDMMARRPRPELYPFAAMHLMALVGSKRSSVYTEKLNLTTLAIAPTAAGKEVAQDAIKRLANLVYCSKYIHGNAGSFKELVINLLEGDGASLYTVDEVHSFLGSMNHKNAATYETKMEAEILTMSTTQLYTFRGSEKRHLIKAYKDDLKSLEKVLEGKDDDSEETKKLRRIAEQTRNRIEWLENGLPNPFFSLMGHSVPERMDSFIKLENIDSGFIGRALIMRCPESREKLRRKIPRNGEEAFLEVSIIEALTRIKRDGLIIDATPDAADYLDAAVDWYDDDDQRNHPVVGGIYARAPEHLFRVATILALSRGTIELEHAKYAHAMVKQSIADVMYILLKALAESSSGQEWDVKEHGRQTVHRNTKGTGETYSKLEHLVTKPKSWQEMQRKDVTRDYFAELIEWMLTQGELEKVTNGRRERYRSKAVV